MTGFARWPAAAAETTADIAATSVHVTDFQVASDERIGVPVRRARSKGMRRVVLLVLLGGSGYAIYEEPSRAPRWWSLATELAAPLIDRALQRTTAVPAKESATLFPTTPPMLGQSPPTDTPDAVAAPDPTAPAPAASAGVSVAPLAPELITRPSEPPMKPPSVTTTAHVQPTVEMPAYAPPQKATVVDPFEARAKAAGLHPDLSRALLTQLSDTDYRNAAYATRTALARTPENGTFKWPKRREAGQALFEVHFVPGAPPDCRRYVVTIEMQKWLTTAPPVDTCSVGPKHLAH